MRKAASPSSSPPILFLSVPVGPDAVVFNAGRRYGRTRLPLLLHGWSVLAVYGWGDEGSASTTATLQSGAASSSSSEGSASASSAGKRHGLLDADPSAAPLTRPIRPVWVLTPKQSGPGASSKQQNVAANVPVADVEQEPWAGDKRGSLQSVLSASCSSG